MKTITTTRSLNLLLAGLAMLVLAPSAHAFAFSYDMTNNGIGQDLEDTVPNSTGTQSDGVFTTTLSAPSPGTEANGDGSGPATGDANEFDDGESVTLTITLDSISTLEPAAAFTLTGLDFDGVGEDSPGGDGFEYFTISSPLFTTFRLVDQDVTDSMITNEGLNPADFTRLGSGDELTGLNLSLGTLNVGDSADITFAFTLSATSTGATGSLSRIDIDATPVPEPGSAVLALGFLLASLARRRRA